MAYGLEVWNSAGEKRLSITGRTVLFTQNYAGTYSGPVSVYNGVDSSDNWAIIDNVNRNGGTITVGSGVVTMTGYSGQNYNFTIYRF